MGEQPEKKKKKRFTLFSDFKVFISKGNVMQLAVAVIIGAAFGKIVTSLVGDIIMPLIMLAIGKRNLNSLKWTISPAEYTVDGVLAKEATVLAYGSFIQSIIDFLIIAFCIFMIVRFMARAQNKVEKMRRKNKGAETQDATPPPPPPPTQEELLTQIRDLLATQIAPPPAPLDDGPTETGDEPSTELLAATILAEGV